MQSLDQWLSQVDYICISSWDIQIAWVQKCPKEYNQRIKFMFRIICLSTIKNIIYIYIYYKRPQDQNDNHLMQAGSFYYVVQYLYNCLCSPMKQSFDIVLFRTFVSFKSDIYKCFFRGIVIDINSSYRTQHGIQKEELTCIY